MESSNQNLQNEEVCPYAKTFVIKGPTHEIVFEHLAACSLPTWRNTEWRFCTEECWSKLWMDCLDYKKAKMDGIKVE